VGGYNVGCGGAWCATLNPKLGPDMITVANRATPKLPTLEQQKTDMTSEGASPEGQMPEPAPPVLQPTGPVTRPTMRLPHTPRGVLGLRKA